MFKTAIFILFINLCFNFRAFSQEQVNEVIAKQDSTLSSLEKTDKESQTDIDTSVSVQELAIMKSKRDYENILKTGDKKSIHNARNTLIDEYEKTIPIVCMPNFYKEQKYEPNSNNNKCTELVNELLLIYPYSPIALCAKYGYNDPKCIESYTHIEISNSIPPKNEEKELPELSAFLEKIETLKMPKLEEMLLKSQEIYKTNNTTRNLLNVIAISDKIVNNLCDKNEEHYTDKCTTCKETNDPAIEMMDFFADLKKDQKNNNKSSEKEKIKQVDKILYISKDCQDFLNRISQIEPKYPSTICEFHGKYSPTCLNALKAWTLYIKSKYAIENKERNIDKKTKTDPNAFESF